MANRIVFLDVESTGLHAELGHRPWEVAIVELDGSGQTWKWRPADHTMVDADEYALQIGAFHQRAPKDYDVVGERVCAMEIAAALNGAVLAGSNPGFDLTMVRYWLEEHDLELKCHWRTIDVPTLAAGWLASYGDPVDVPISSTDVSKRLGVQRWNAHTAWADADWCRRMWLQIGASDVA
jgi:DNA polymerase III epsilon subunit-like protein